MRRIVPEENAWFYTAQWQKKLARARDDVAEGRTATFDSMTDLFADLENEPDNMRGGGHET